MRDITGTIGDLYPTERPPEWPMYSYSRPAWIVWQSIADQLYANGWSEKQIQEWLQSKHTRWALDFSLGDALREVATAWAAELGGPE